MIPVSPFSSALSNPISISGHEPPSALQSFLIQFNQTHRHLPELAGVPDLPVYDDLTPIEKKEVLALTLPRRVASWNQSKRYATEQAHRLKQQALRTYHVGF